MMNRRSFMQSILAASAAPWVCTTAGVLMPVRKIIASPQSLVFPNGVAGDMVSIVQYKDGRVLFTGSNTATSAGVFFGGETGLFLCTGTQWLKVGDP